MARAIWIPVGTDEPISEVDVTIKYPEPGRFMKKRNGPQSSGYIELVRTDVLRSLHPSVVMVVDEEGLIRNLDCNGLASLLYSGPTPICGGALLLSEGYVPDEDGFEELDLIALDPSVTVKRILQRINNGA